MNITFEQFARGIAAIDSYGALIKAVSAAFRLAGEERVDSLGGGGVVEELTRQLEERCGDPSGGIGGSMIEYMLYDGRSHGGRCVADNGREFSVNSPEALWAWWEATESGPFTPPAENNAAVAVASATCADGQQKTPQNPTMDRGGEPRDDRR